SKLRFPDSTDATMSLLSSTTLAIGSGNGPEFPMHVVQPYPTRLNPRASRSFCTPAALRYSVTTLEPGASDVLTHGFVFSPIACAFRASSPAPSITLGLEVLVQLVIAAMTTAPWRSLKVAPLYSQWTPWSSCTGLLSSSSTITAAVFSGSADAAVAFRASATPA